MNIRQFRDADRSDLAALQIASWRAAYVGLVDDEHLGPRLDREVTKRWREISLGLGEFVLIAEDQEGFSGFVTLLAQEMPFIDNFHVRPGLYRSGIGRALMRATAVELLRLGETKVALTVLEANTRALAFYRALGGTEASHFEHEFLGRRQPVIRMEWYDLEALSRV